MIDRVAGINTPLLHFEGLSSPFPNLPHRPRDQRWQIDCSWSLGLSFRVAWKIVFGTLMLD